MVLIAMYMSVYLWKDNLYAESLYTSVVFFGECDGPMTTNSAVSLQAFVNQTILLNANFEPKTVNILTSNCLILCSSRTTGHPKAVQLSQFGIFSTIRDFMDC